jgi:hypothetical protein
MVVSLKVLGYAHAFVIVLNYADPRRSEYLQDTIKLFSQMFGTDFFKNALLLFTRFGHDKREIWRREEGKEMKEVDVIE